MQSNPHSEPHLVPLSWLSVVVEGGVGDSVVETVEGAGEVGGWGGGLVIRDHDLPESQFCKHQTLPTIRRDRCGHTNLMLVAGFPQPCCVHVRGGGTDKTPRPFNTRICRQCVKPIAVPLTPSSLHSIQPSGSPLPTDPAEAL